MNSKVYLDPPGAVAWLKNKGLSIEAATLATLRCRGGGPPFQKWGRQPIYDPELLDQWAEGRLSSPRLSTSEPAAA